MSHPGLSNHENLVQIRTQQALEEAQHARAAKKTRKPGIFARFLRRSASAEQHKLKPDSKQPALPPATTCAPRRDARSRTNGIV